jgi:hypothetical protein
MRNKLGTHPVSDCPSAPCIAVRMSIAIIANNLNSPIANITDAVVVSVIRLGREKYQFYSIDG